MSSAQRAASRRGEVVASAFYELGLFVDGPIENGLGLHEMQSHRLTLDVGYGVTPWLTPSVAMPVRWNTMDAQIGPDPDDRESRGVAGLGDSSLLLKFTVVGAKALAPGDLRVWLAPGVEVPTGPSDSEDAFGCIPPQAQLGSGTWDVLAGGFASIGLTGEAGKLLLLNSVVVKLTTENPEPCAAGFDDPSIGTRSAHRFGHSLEAASLAQLRLTSAWSARLGPILRVAGVDRVRAPGASSRAVGNSGGRLLLARGGVAWNVADDTALGLDLQTPVLQDVNGGQLDPVFSATLGVIVGWQ